VQTALLLQSAWSGDLPSGIDQQVARIVSQAKDLERLLATLKHLGPPVTFRTGAGGYTDVGNAFRQAQISMMRIAGLIKRARGYTKNYLEAERYRDRQVWAFSIRPGLWVQVMRSEVAPVEPTTWGDTNPLGASAEALAVRVDDHNH
jgi:hypothetical protein